MLNRGVIPNEMRDLASGDGLRNEICVIKASSGRSFAPLSMTRVLSLWL
jgi:hypothetical protein